MASFDGLMGRGCVIIVALAQACSVYSAAVWQLQTLNALWVKSVFKSFIAFLCLCL